MKASEVISAVEVMRLMLKDRNIDFVEEYVFHASRKWRFDFAIPARRVAVEIEGGTYGRPVVCGNCGQKVSRTSKNGLRYYVREAGRHNRAATYAADCEKYNASTIDGWKVLRFTSDMIYESPSTCVAIIRQCMGGE